MPTNNDSRKNAFFRKATAVIMASGGLTADCQSKLRALAIDLRLSDNEFVEAFRAFQEAPPVSQEWSRYELHFRGFLLRELQGLPSPVLNLPLENRALDIAQSKFQVGMTRARQIIESVCDDLKLQRVSLTDAESYVEMVLVEELGQQVFLSDEQTQRLYVLAQSWGVTPERVDQFIEQSLAANWRIQRRQRTERRFKMVMVTAIAMGVITVSGFWIWALRQQGTVNDPPLRNESRDVLPRWWEPVGDLTNSEGLLIHYPQFDLTLERLKSAAESERPLLFGELAVQAQLANSVDSMPLADLMLRWLALDANSQANWLTDSLVSELLVCADQPRDEPTLIQQWNGYHVLSQIAASHARERPDVQLAQQSLRRTLNWTEEMAITNESLESAWARQTWTKIAEISEVDPQAALRLTAVSLQLGDLMKDQHSLAMANQISLDVLFRDFSMFEWIQTLARTLILTADDLALERWLELLDRNRDQPAHEVIQAATLDRLPTVPDTLQVASALTGKKMSLRKERLRELVDDSHSVEASEARTNLELAQPGRPENASIVLQGLLTQVDQSLLTLVKTQGRFDPQLGVLASNLRRSVDLFELREEALNRPMLGVEDARSLRSLLSRLEGLDPQDSTLRISAVDKIARVTESMTDLSVENSIRLARYVLSDLNLAERLEVEKHLAQFGAWPHFLLSLADEINSARLTEVEALSALQLMTGQSLQFKVGMDWQTEFERRCRRLALIRLEATPENRESASRKQWATCQDQFLASQRFRARLFGASPAESSSDPIWQLASGLRAARHFANDSLLDRRLAEFIGRNHPSDLAATIVLYRQLTLARIEQLLVFHRDGFEVEPFRTELANFVWTEHSQAECLLEIETIFYRAVIAARRFEFNHLMQTGRLE